MAQDISSFLRECNSFMSYSAPYLPLTPARHQPYPQAVLLWQAPAPPIPWLAPAPISWLAPAPIPRQAPPPGARDADHHQHHHPPPAAAATPPPPQPAASRALVHSPPHSQASVAVCVKEEPGTVRAPPHPNRAFVLELLTRYRTERSEEEKLLKPENHKLLNPEVAEKPEKLNPEVAEKPAPVPEAHKRKRQRLDLNVATRLREQGLWESRQWLGPVPGVEVGDRFFYRSELRLVSLHRQTQAGIDTIFSSQVRCRVATAVVTMVDDGCNLYKDDSDHGEELIYSGQGGSRNQDKEKRCAVDQKLERGNAGLMGSCEQGTPVRVIRGYRGRLPTESPSNVVYSYDGLYTVKEAKYERGVRGNMVYKFRMVRMKNQAPLVMLRSPGSSSRISKAVALSPASIIDGDQQQQKRKIVGVSRSGSSPGSSVERGRGIWAENGKLAEPEEQEEMMNSWEVSSAGSELGPHPLDFQEPVVDPGNLLEWRPGTEVAGCDTGPVGRVDESGTGSSNARARLKAIDKTRVDKMMKMEKNGVGGEGDSSSSVLQLGCRGGDHPVNEPGDLRLSVVVSPGGGGGDPVAHHKPAVAGESSSSRALAIDAAGKAPGSEDPGATAEAPKLTGEASENTGKMQGTGGKQDRAPEQQPARKRRSYPDFETFIGKRL